MFSSPFKQFGLDAKRLGIKFQRNQTIIVLFYPSGSEISDPNRSSHYNLIERVIKVPKIRKLVIARWATFGILIAYVLS